jgi:hypothetical protein
MDKNDEHFITTHLNKLNENDKYCFFCLTKYIMELQQNNKFQILNYQPEEGGHLANMFNNFPWIDIRPTDYFHIAQLYKNAELFKEIKKYIHRETKINKKLSPIVNQCFKSKEEQTDFKKLINLIVLFNLIKSQLENKTHQDLRNYCLMDKLNAVNPNMVGWLNLYQLNNLTTAEQMNDYWTNYKYDNMRITNVANHITDEEYNKVFRIFSLFI